MRPPGNNTKPIIFGFILVIGITLPLPHFAFGAARSFGGSGRFKASRIHRTFGPAHSSGGFRRFGAPVIQRQPSFLHDLETSGRFHRQDFFSHPFHGFGFGGGVGGFSEQPVIIIQQFQPATAAQPSEHAENRIYVQPRWVDGGHGVEVLQPGYWAEPKQAAGR
jgi:hypothetical protein